MVIQPIVEEGIGDDIIAVISAAVASMFGGGESGQPAAEGGFVLRSIRRARERTSWAQAGMMQNTPTFLIDGGQRQCLKFLRTRSRRSCPSRAS